MSRLIDAEKLVKYYRDEYHGGYSEIQLAPYEVVNIIEEQSTVDSKDNWIPCSEGLPKERDSIFAKFKGTSTWNNAMFEKTSDDVNVTIEFPNGERMTRTMHTTDGKWNLNFRSIDQKIVAWQPLPDPFKVADSK